MLNGHKIDRWLKSVGFVACLYIRKQGEVCIILMIHVADQLIASNNRQHVDSFKQLLNKEFECKDNGPISQFLGKITRDRGNKRVYIFQERYLEDVLDRFDLSHCSPVSSTAPADFKPKAATDEEFESAKHLPYPQIVGSLLYAAVITRPDIAHAVSTLSRYLAKWNESHYRAQNTCCAIFEEHWTWTSKAMRTQTGAVIWTLGA